MKHIEEIGKALVAAHRPATINYRAKFGVEDAQSCQKLYSIAGCDACGAELEDKVIAFCRLNSKRLGGRKLCRECQGTAVSA